MADLRVLIATVTAGGGHLAAANALEEAWRENRPGDTVEKVDVLKFSSGLERRMHERGYVELAQHAPEIWGMVYARTDDPVLARRLTRLRRMFPTRLRSRFSRFVNEFRPDAVLCTHYTPLETLAGCRKESAKVRNGQKVTRNAGARRSRLFVTSVVTDFEAHALWMDECVDLYCVATEQTKARLIARGASRQNVIATGIPVAARFSARVDAAAVRSRMGLRDDHPVLLVLSGGFGMGPVAEMVAQLDKAGKRFQMVIVCGRNEELRRDLAISDRAHPAHVLGFASNMHELMAVADLIVSKPGGLTTSEALAKGKPLLIVNPIPGQEAANSDFLLEQGAAIKVNRAEDLPFRLDQLLGSKKLGDLSNAAKALGQSRAAAAICSEVSARVEAMDQEPTEAVES